MSLMCRGLQIDFNLFGMGFLRLEDVIFRGAVPVSRSGKKPGWQEAESLTHKELSSSGRKLQEDPLSIY